VIASRISAHVEMLGDNALYFDPNDERSITRAITEFRSVQGMRADLIREGNKRYSLFSWEKIARDYHELYSSL